VAHLVENMFSVKEVPWHKLGKIVSEAPNVTEAIKLAGLDWTVEKKQLFTQEGVLAPAMAVVRNTDNSVLGVVGKQWTPVQNEKAFEFFNEFVEKGECSLETAGSLKNGQRIFVLAKLNRDPMRIVGDDLVNKYLLLSNGHDGYCSVRVGFTPIRVVCANTLHQADNHKSSMHLRIAHKSKVNESLDKVQETINAANARFEATADQYRAMLRMNVTTDDIKKFVNVVFVPEKMDHERQEIRLNNMTETITKIFETGYGMNIKGVSGTGWALYNAATQYLSHEFGRNEEARVNGLWFNGVNSKLNKKAFDYVMEEVKV
jgi:phage/plasmid-like protein (TIGR03299 family)